MKQNLGVVRRAGVTQPELLRRYCEERRPADLEQLVRMFRPLVRRLALGYAKPGHPIEDLEQVAYLGLLKALDRFDPDQGFAFTSFAVPTISGELKRYIRDTAWAVRVPRSLQEGSAQVREAAEELSRHAGRAPTSVELAEATGLAAEDVAAMLQVRTALVATSFDAPSRGGEDEDGTLLERIGSMDDGYERVEDLDAIDRAAPALTEIQRDVLRLRFSEDLKQSEIASRVGVSPMHVSRVLRAAVARLAEVANQEDSVPA